MICKRPVNTALPLAKKILLSVISTVLAIACLECTLRIAGLYMPTGFLVKIPDGRYYTSNQQFLRRFYSGQAATGKILPFRVAVNKPSNTRRILILGESAAQGTPEPAFGFARILQVMLDSSGADCQVINAAMRGVDSSIILYAMRDLVQLRPDVVILYIGNNELVGLHGATEGLLQRWLSALRQKASVLAIGQLAWRIAPRHRDTIQDMAYFRRFRVRAADPRRKAVYRRFRVNIQQICKLASACNAKVIVCTVAVNLKDCPPFGSLHRNDLGKVESINWQTLYNQAVAVQQAGRIDKAIELYQSALRIDDQYAELHFRLAGSLIQAGQLQAAQRHLQLACDLDALGFRADGQINSGIRDLASKYQDGPIVLVDLAKAFADAYEGMPGQECFHDHVHLNLDGDYLVASRLLPVIQELLGIQKSQILSKDYCSERLAFNTFAALQIEAGMVQTISRPPFLDQLDHHRRYTARARKVQAQLDELIPSQLGDAALAYQMALSRDPSDWYIHRLYAFLAIWQQDVDTALKHLDCALRLMPEYLPTIIQYADICAQAGRRQEAIRHYRRALSLDPFNRQLRQALASIAGR